MVHNSGTKIEFDPVEAGKGPGHQVKGSPQSKSANADAWRRTFEDSPGLVSSMWLKKVLDDEYHTAHRRLRLIDVSLFDETPEAARAAYEATRVPSALFYDMSIHGDGGLPGAEAFDKLMVEMDVGSKNDVILYDRGGMTSAPRLWWMLRAFGHERCAVLDGGLPAWVASGYATETGVFAPKKKFAALATTFDAELDPRIACSAAADGATRIDPRGGLLAAGEGTVSLAHSRLLTAEGNLLDPADLKKLFEEAGVPKEGPLAIECGSAEESALVALALDVVGREAAVQSGGGRRMLNHVAGHLQSGRGVCSVVAACDDDTGRGRRLTHGACLSDGACARDETTAAWFDEWRHSLDDWFGGLPLPEQAAVGNCVTALGLHLGSRFDGALNAWRALLGKSPRPPTSAAGAAEPGCEWLGEGAASLPEFPAFPNEPDAFKAPVLPIPSLLPEMQKQFFIQSTLTLPNGHDGYLAGHGARGQTSSTTAVDQVAAVTVGAGAGAGGALLALVLFGIGRSVRGHSGRVSVRGAAPSARAGPVVQGAAPSDKLAAPTKMISN